MEFRFNINRLLPRKINKISHTLIPEDFRGDRRELNECQRLLTRVLDDMGEASAEAQGLSKPITSAVKLRDTDHLVYLLVDHEGNNGYGCVVGLLKTGSKNLFMFDEDGIHYQLQPRCILDFYVHESRQRMGLGNVLYQHMLAEEKTRPVKLAIDRPSEKFLQFLRKHYGLDRIIPQNNKFVVFRGFFDDESQDTRSNRYSLPPRTGTDGDSQGNNNHHNGSNNNCKSSSSSNGAQFSGVSRSAYGRYAAARPPCSMANIIHNAAVLGQAAERTGESSKNYQILPKTDSSDPQPDHKVPNSASKLERPRSLSLYSEEEQKQRTGELSTVPTPALPEPRSAPFVPAETTIVDRSRRQSIVSSAASAVPERPETRATSAAFGPIVDHQTSRAFNSMHLEAIPVEKPSSAFSSNRHETASVEKPSTAFSSNNRRETPSVEKPSTAFSSNNRREASSVEKPSSAFSSNNRREAPLAEKPSTAFSSVHRENPQVEKPSTAGSVKASPSCAQEVSGNQPGHLDLKFYHSPLW